MSTWVDLFEAALKDAADVVADACDDNPNHLPDEVCAVGDEPDRDKVKEWVVEQIYDDNISEVNDILWHIDQDAKREQAEAKQ